MGNIRHIVTKEFKREGSGFARTVSGGFVVIYGVWDTNEHKFVGPMYESEAAALLQAEMLDGEGPDVKQRLIEIMARIIAKQNVVLRDKGIVDRRISKHSRQLYRLCNVCNVLQLPHREILLTAERLSPYGA